LKEKGRTRKTKTGRLNRRKDKEKYEKNLVDWAGRIFCLFSGFSIVKSE